ncbi:MAG: hypothetical protein AAF655_20490 [Bacteroidota bacterium]
MKILSFTFRLVISASAILFWVQCSSPTTGEGATEPEDALMSPNPAAEGFNLEASDAKAIEIADEVMQAMGGRKAWDDTRHLSWNFFGFRTLTWDKHSGNVRIDIPSDSTVMLFNIFSKEGKVSMKGEPVTNADSLSKYLSRAEFIWINDSYWLVMPFKLKDSGVTLGYEGQDSTLAGNLSDVLSLTFEEVGVTPQNKYLVYVDPETNLITQWDYFADATQETTERKYPWNDYQQYGDIMLSGNRGERGITDIRVEGSLPESVYTEF